MLDCKYNQIKYSYYLFIKHEDKLRQLWSFATDNQKIGIQALLHKNNAEVRPCFGFFCLQNPPRDVHNVSLCYKKTQWPKPSGCIILSSAVFFGNKCED